MSQVRLGGANGRVTVAREQPAQCGESEPHSSAPEEMAAGNLSEGATGREAGLLVVCVHVAGLPSLPRSREC